MKTGADNHPRSRGLPLPAVSEKPKRNLAWVWFIPLAAAIIGSSILWRQWANQRPMIRITFQSAADLQEGKTAFKFRDVVIGLVLTQIDFS